MYQCNLNLLLLAVISFTILAACLDMRQFSPLKSTAMRSINLLNNVVWPDRWPYTKHNFVREDETQDHQFYSQPRFVYHIDNLAVSALTDYYRSVFIPGMTILDICSSWVSHFPENLQLNEACGIGLSKEELSGNKQLTSFVDKDLNADPTLPYEDNKFDIVTCVVSVDYLTQPLEIFREIRRVLKPGGIAIMSQSNRCFPSKAIDMWLRVDDMGRLRIIGSYFYYAGGFNNLVAYDISPNPGRSDPMYIVQATKEDALK